MTDEAAAALVVEWLLFPTLLTLGLSGLWGVFRRLF